MGTDADAGPKASAAGAQPDPMTTATSCGPPRVAVRASAAEAASASGEVAAGSVPEGWFTRGRYIAGRETRVPRPGGPAMMRG